MGMQKHEQQEREDRWASGNARCVECSQSIPYVEREQYFKNGRCGYCEHLANKDD